MTLLCGHSFFLTSSTLNSTSIDVSMPAAADFAVALPRLAVTEKQQGTGLEHRQHDLDPGGQASIIEVAAERSRHCGIERVMLPGPAGATPSRAEHRPQRQLIDR